MSNLIHNLPDFKREMSKQQTPFYKLNSDDIVMLKNRFGIEIFEDMDINMIVDDSVLCIDMSFGYNEPFTPAQEKEVWQILFNKYRRDRDSGIESFTLLSRSPK